MAGRSDKLSAGVETCCEEVQLFTATAGRSVAVLMITGEKIS